MTTTTKRRPPQAGKLATGTEIKTAKPGAKLRFGGGLYLLVSPTGTRSWQVHYHVGAKHQATIVGRWPDLGVGEAKAARDAIRRTVRDGDDPAHDRRERTVARIEANAATVRIVADAWLAIAPDARRWSAYYLHLTRQRLANHVLPVIGDRPIGRVTVLEIEALIGEMRKPTKTRPALVAQAVHVRQALQALFDYAGRRRLVTENPVRMIGVDLPSRSHDAEASFAHVKTIDDARSVLRAVEASTKCWPFAKLVHRLIALTAVRKMEGVGAQWSEVSADGITWTIPADRMKGRRGHKLDHAIPLSPQAADIFRAARALAAELGIVGTAVFPGQGGVVVWRNCLNDLLADRLRDAGLAGRHTVHGWRSTFSTLCNEADPTAYRVIDVMLAHRTFGAIERRYNHAVFLAERRRIACAWADRLLDGAPSAFALAGMVEPASNVMPLREAA